MSRPVGTLDRALADIVIGAQQEMKARERSLSDTKLGEFTQQVHVPLSGELFDAYWHWVDHKINWLMPFLWAPLQRQIPFQHPHFSYGVEWLSPPSTLIEVHAQVISWTTNNMGWDVGATIRFMVQAPYVVQPPPVTTLTKPSPPTHIVKDTPQTAPTTAPTQAGYNTNVHLTFQGFACNPEGDEFQT